ncbi:YicC/YloC family endoribonuclease [Diplocloster agilis]|uniref:YicC/YloC family endoribonuclease n=1 Tax=Diplocloster agilis TaxID=2850323 RepID=UPI0008212CCA|nr:MULTISPECIES: YicC/YloC family endoribonuclease [Lachnospiraceae]MBU9746450.1 YicC family protein [Diplocloster agilis]MCU6736966.1 YicC family protein [Suonthocola fibrivorans]SCJ94836.1 YicC-like family%2C N-terminal region [uncultured Clostridium sp.]
MVKSMTGFGRSEAQDENRKFLVEMKAVNHRYLDINIRMPKKLAFFETAIRSLLKNYIQRGKVDVFISYEDYTENKLALRYNGDIAAEYLQYMKKMAQNFELEDNIHVSTLARMPEVFTLEDQAPDEKELWALLEQALKGAAEQFVETRIVEGEHLKNDLLAKLDGMSALVDEIERRSPEIVREYREKLEEKVKELLADTQIEESRIATEVVIYADKICVDEEMVRLRSHIAGTKAALSSGDGVGRKLDFIAQELNREANTILSKANDMEISNVAIDLKTEIEKVREQIQNIE